MPAQLSNINLFVADVARSAEFFVTLFGMNWDHSAGADFAYLGGGPISITIQSATTPGAVIGQADSVEIGFEAADLAELTSLRQTIEATGVEISPTQAMGWGTTFDFRDPNGVRLTVYCSAKG